MKLKLIMTKSGIKKIYKKIKELKEKDLPKIINEISLTRKLGDLSENTEYQTAKKIQNLTEKKINDMEEILFNCKYINKEKIDKEIINISAKVIIINLNNNKISKYKILCNEEINKRGNFISSESIMGRLLLGKKINDIIYLKKFKKYIKYKILNIEY